MKLLRIVKFQKLMKTKTTDNKVRIVTLILILVCFGALIFGLTAMESTQTGWNLNNVQIEHQRSGANPE